MIMRRNFSTVIRFMCLILSIGQGFTLWAQDPNFSQFYNNPVYYNPGMTAIGNGFTFRSHARSLWTPIPGKFDTYSASFEAEAINKVGLGVLAYSDVAGEGLLRTTGGNLYYSYRAVDTRNFIFQVGFSGGVINKYVDWTKFTFSDQLDEVFGKINNSTFIQPNFNSTTYADFGSGFALRFNNKSRKSGTSYKRSIVTIGGAVHHLTRPNDAFIGDKEKLPMKFTFHGNANLLIQKIIYSPAFIFERQNQFQTFTIGASVVNKPFSVGFWMRNRTYLMSGKSYDSFITTLGVNVPVNRASNLRITYAFDMTLSRLRTASIGSHELSLILDFDNQKLFKGIQMKNRNKRRFKCPTDFKGYD